VGRATRGIAVNGSDPRKKSGGTGSDRSAAANNIVVTTTGAGEEKRTFSMAGGDLIVETSAPARDGRGPNVTKVTTYKEIRARLRRLVSIWVPGSGFEVLGRTQRRVAERLTRDDLKRIVV